MIEAEGSRLLRMLISSAFAYLRRLFSGVARDARSKGAIVRGVLLVAAGLAFSFLGWRAVVTIQLIACGWAAVQYFRNSSLLRARKEACREGHIFESGDCRKDEILVLANRWSTLLILAAATSATLAFHFREEPGSPGAKVASVVVWGATLLWVYTMGAGTDNRNRQVVVTGPEADDAAWRRALRGVHFPVEWIFPEGTGFPRIFFAAWGIGVLAALGLFTPAYGDIPKAAARTFKHYLPDLLGMAPEPEEEPTARKSPSETPIATSAPPVPPTSEDPPAECGPERSVALLRDRGISDKATIGRILEARRRFSWPIIGCDVPRVLPRRDSTLVIYTGPESAKAVIVDDGRHANAALTQAAADIIRTEFGLDDTLTALSSSERAGTGRWHLERHGPRSCNLLEVPDGADRAFALTEAETSAYLREAARSNAFPMLAPYSTDAVHVVEYIKVDKGSPTGYIADHTRSYTTRKRAAFPTEDLVGCGATNRYLTRVGDLVETAAHDG